MKKYRYQGVTGSPKRLYKERERSERVSQLEESWDNQFCWRVGRLVVLWREGGGGAAMIELFGLLGVITVLF